MDPNLLPDEKPPIKVTHRTNRSIPMFILQHLIKPFGHQLIKPKKEFPAGSPRLNPAKRAKKHCEVTERVVEDVHIYDIVPKRPRVDTEGGTVKQPKRIYYFCGGGYQMPASPQHWSLCAELARQLSDTTVSIVSYPLAPNSPAPVAIPQLLKMYRRILQDAEDAKEHVTFMGDSAGGNIVLCLPLAALREDETAPCPDSLFVICPSCDLRGQDPDEKHIEKHDPILRIPFTNDNARKWRAEWDGEDPRVTPVMADVTPLARRGVKVHGVMGRYDILFPGALLFRFKCEEAGVEGEWLDWEKQMHCFPLAWSYGLSESVQAKDWILDVLRQG